MTKERKLAIDMWTNIRNMLSVSDGQLPESISRYKAVFCHEHGLQWEYTCWFCQYIRDCVKCPLGGCGYNSYFDTATMAWLNTDTRIEACNAIIKALGGKV